jgi:hypothetical protein
LQQQTASPHTSKKTIAGCQRIKNSKEANCWYFFFWYHAKHQVVEYRVDGENSVTIFNFLPNLAGYA